MSDYEVGRGKPPKNAQFKPGRSGNSRGRPRKTPRAEIPSQLGRDIREVCRREVIIKTPGGHKQVTIFQAALHRLAMEAIGGKISAMKLLISLQMEGYLENILRNDVYGNFDKLISKFGDPNLSNRMLDDWAVSLAEYSKKG